MLKCVPESVPDSVDVSGARGQAWTLVSNAIAVFPQASVAVGCSGGPDSAALAIVARDICQSMGRRLSLLHVHHGLQADADAWAQSVRELGRLLDVPVMEQRVSVDLRLGDGVEGAARQARYTALAHMMQTTGSDVLLLAHHRQDQAETVLFRLFRGAGVHGLQAMQAQSERDGVLILRPWLDLDRPAVLAIVDRFSAQQAWIPVQDPTNTDPTYARGVLRSKLIPEIAQHWPQWASSLSRHARQAAEAGALLDEVADEWLSALDPGTGDESFSLKRWRDLPAARQQLVLRRWLAKQGCRMPSEARLAELVRQLQTVHALGHDRALTWEHDGRIVYCERGRVTCRQA